MTTTAGHWIIIDREAPSHDVLVGPYPTVAAAEHAMTEATLVDHLLSPSGGGGVDARLSTVLDPDAEQHWIDLTDSAHTGVEDIAAGARLALQALLLADQGEDNRMLFHVESSLDSRWPGATDRVSTYVTAQHMSPSETLAWAQSPTQDSAAVVRGEKAR